MSVASNSPSQDSFQVDDQISSWYVSWDQTIFYFGMAYINLLVGKKTILRLSVIIIFEKKLVLNTGSTSYIYMTSQKRN